MNKTENIWGISDEEYVDLRAQVDRTRRREIIGGAIYLLLLVVAVSFGLLSALS